MSKNKQSNFIASVKMSNIGFINKYIINSGISRGGGYSVLVNYQSLLSNIFPLAPQLFFFIKYRRNRLLRVSFIRIIISYDLPACKQENYNVIISHFPHSPLMQPLNHAVLPISMPRFKSIIFY